MPELTRDDFAVGMSVTCIKDYPDSNLRIKAGDTGVVVAIHPRDIRKPIGVQWYHLCGGHDLNGKSAPGHGWWCPIDYVMPVTFAGIDDDIDEADFASLDELYGG